MPFLPAILTLVAAVIGVFGKTWEPDRAGVKRITLKGWVVIGLAIASAWLTMSKIAADRAERAAFKQVAGPEVVAATDRLLAPFRDLFVKFTGPPFLQSSGVMSERDGLRRAREAIPVSELVSEPFISYLSSTSATDLSGDARSGVRLTHVDYIARRAAEGRGALEKCLALGGDLLPTPLRTAAQTVLGSAYMQAAEARPTVMRSGQSGPVNILPPSDDKRFATIVAEYKAYVSAVEDLRVAASTK